LPANQPCGALHSLDQQYLLHIVNLLQLHFDDLVLSRLDHSSDIPSLDGKFAPAAIDQHTELDACRTTLIEERVKSGANCAPSVQDVIEEDNVFAGDTEVDFGVIEDRLHADGGKVVAIQVDIQNAGGDLDVLERCNLGGKSVRDRSAAATDTNEGEMEMSSVFSRIS